MALVVLALVVTLIILFWVTVAQSQAAAKMSSPEEDLSPEARTMFRRLKNLRSELEKAGERGKGEASPFIVNEALQESRSLLEQSFEALRLRDRLKKERTGAYQAEKGVQELEERAGAAHTEEERRSLEGALAARRQELAHYAKIEESIRRIDFAIQQAEAALGEIRARVAAHAVAGMSEEGTEDLREAIGRMKALTKSVDEIEEIA